METKQIKSAKDLRIYKKAYALAMEIFHSAPVKSTTSFQGTENLTGPR